MVGRRWWVAAIALRCAVGGGSYVGTALFPTYDLPPTTQCFPHLPHTIYRPGTPHPRDGRGVSQQAKAFPAIPF